MTTMYEDESGLTDEEKLRRKLERERMAALSKPANEPIAGVKDPNVLAMPPAPAVTPAASVNTYDKELAELQRLRSQIQTPDESMSPELKQRLRDQAAPLDAAIERNRQRKAQYGNGDNPTASATVGNSTVTVTGDQIQRKDPVARAATGVLRAEGEAQAPEPPKNYGEAVKQGWKTAYEIQGRQTPEGGSGLVYPPGIAGQEMLTRESGYIAAGMSKLDAYKKARDEYYHQNASGQNRTADQIVNIATKRADLQSMAGSPSTFTDQTNANDQFTYDGRTGQVTRSPTVQPAKSLYERQGGTIQTPEGHMPANAYLNNAAEQRARDEADRTGKVQWLPGRNGDVATWIQPSDRPGIQASPLSPGLTPDQDRLRTLDKAATMYRNQLATPGMTPEARAVAEKNLATVTQDMDALHRQMNPEPAPVAATAVATPRSRYNAWKIQADKDFRAGKDMSRSVYDFRPLDYIDADDLAHDKTLQKDLADVRNVQAFVRQHPEAAREAMQYLDQWANTHASDRPTKADREEVEKKAAAARQQAKDAESLRRWNETRQTQEQRRKEAEAARADKPLESTSKALGRADELIYGRNPRQEKNKQGATWTTWEKTPYDHESELKQYGELTTALKNRYDMFVSEYTTAGYDLPTINRMWEMCIARGSAKVKGDWDKVKASMASPSPATTSQPAPMSYAPSPDTQSQPPKSPDQAKTLDGMIVKLEGRLKAGTAWEDVAAELDKTPRFVESLTPMQKIRLKALRDQYAKRN